MGKFIDLTGQKFGRWTVIKRAEDRLSKNGIIYRYWLCECCCEKHTRREVREYSLINKTSQSCGCKSKETIRENIKNNEIIPDLIGKVFGDWTVLSQSDYVNGSRYWNCKCSCGTERAISERHLLDGNSKSCGHVKDLTGKKFGRLVVLYRVEDKILSDGTHSSMWMCKCICGNEKVIEGRLLNSGVTKSCGCLQYEISCKNLNQKKYNTYDLSGEYGVGYTNNKDSQGRNYFWFDIEDYELIKNYCWYFSNDYVVSHDELHKTIFLHKLIMPSSAQVDHIQHEKYDNRKIKLRIATNAENGRNQGIQSNNTSGVTGVSWHKQRNAWQSYIGINGKNLYLGIHSNKNDAIKARIDAENEHFGEWSYANSMNQNNKSLKGE